MRSGEGFRLKGNGAVTKKKKISGARPGGSWAGSSEGRRGGRGVTNEVRGMNEKNEAEVGRWGRGERKLFGGQLVYCLSIIV